MSTVLELPINLALGNHYIFEVRVAGLDSDGLLAYWPPLVAALTFDQEFFDTLADEYPEFVPLVVIEDPNQFPLLGDRPQMGGGMVPLPYVPPVAEGDVPVVEP